MLPRTLLSHHCALQVTTRHTNWPFCIVLSELHSNIFTSGPLLLLYKLCNFLTKLAFCVECCSDGTGRTGTYILIDMVLNRMAKGEVSLYAFVIGLLSISQCFAWAELGAPSGCSIPTGVKEIDIAATLEHVRDQRPGMVRTKVVETTSSCHLLAVKFQFNFMPTCFCNLHFRF